MTASIEELASRLSRKGSWSIGDEGFVIDQVGAFPSKIKALKEYVANSLDAATEYSQEKLEIQILLDTQKGNIIITDNGRGITQESLIGLTRNIGSSKKRQLPGLKHLIGNKAFGMQAFRTFGDRLIVASRNIEERTYNALQMCSGEEPRYGIDLDPNSIPGPSFDYGTRVIISGIEPGTLKSSLSPSNIRREIGRIFEPRIRRDGIKTRILVGTLSNGLGHTTLAPVELPDYMGCVVIESVNKNLESLGVHYPPTELNPNGINAEYEIYLFIDPTSNNPKVRLHNQDVEVCNLTDLEKLGIKPWNSPHLTGYINVNFLELTPTRDGIVDAKGRRLSTLRERVTTPIEKETSAKLEEVLSIHKSNSTSQETRIYRDSLEAIRMAYKSCPFVPPTGYTPRGPRPTSNPKPGSGGNGGGKKPPICGGENGDKNTGDPIVGKNLNYSFVVDSFPPDESHLSYKIDVDTGTAWFNTTHQRYKIEVLKSEDPDRAFRYWGMQFALAISHLDMENWTRKRGETSESYIENIGARATELVSTFGQFSTARKKK